MDQAITRAAGAAHATQPATGGMGRPARTWAILLTSANHGTVGPLGSTFPHAGEKHERVQVMEIVEAGAAPAPGTDLAGLVRITIDGTAIPLDCPSAPVGAAPSIDTPELRRLLVLLSCTSGTDNFNAERKIIAHIDQHVASQVRAARDACHPFQFDGAAPAKWQVIGVDLAADGITDVRAAALEQAAALAVQHTAVPRDLLGPATPQMKALAASGVKLAEKIRALKPAPNPTKEAWPAIPAGWKLVPESVTPEMVTAGGHSNSEWLNDNAPIGEARYAMPMESVWKAMLAAAPSPSISHSGEGAASAEYKPVGKFLYVGACYEATSSDDPRGITLYRPAAEKGGAA